MEPEWPSSEWVQHNAHKHVRASAYWEFMERTEGASIFEARWFSHLAAELRRFADILPAERANLEGLVQWLDDCTESLEGTAYKTWAWTSQDGVQDLHAPLIHTPARLGQAWTCKALLSAFMASRFLSKKCGEHMKQVLTLAAPLLPPGLGNFLENADNLEIPSRSTLHRCQLVCDVALLLERQSANTSEEWERKASYLWWDSSVPWDPHSLHHHAAVKGCQGQNYHWQMSLAVSNVRKSWESFGASVSVLSMRGPGDLEGSSLPTRACARGTGRL